MNYSCHFRAFHTDDAQKLSTVTLLRGYIQLLGSRIDVMLQSSVHLHRLSTALMNILPFDCSIIQIIEERSTGRKLFYSGPIHLIDVNTAQPTKLASMWKLLFVSCVSCSCYIQKICNAVPKGTYVTAEQPAPYVCTSRKITTCFIYLYISTSLIISQFKSAVMLFCCPSCLLLKITVSIPCQLYWVIVLPSDDRRYYENWRKSLDTKIRRSLLTAVLW